MTLSATRRSRRGIVSLLSLRATSIPPLGSVARDLFLDSAVSHIGYHYATVVGFLWGALWSVGRAEKRQGLWVFRGLPSFAFGRGGTCIGGCYLTFQNVTDAVLEHESVHKRQWLRYGMLFPVLYALAGRDALHNRFEIEAGLEKGGYR